MTKVKTEGKNNVIKKKGKTQVQGARVVLKKEKNKDKLSIILI